MYYLNILVRWCENVFFSQFVNYWNFRVSWVVRYWPFLLEPGPTYQPPPFPSANVCVLAQQNLSHSRTYILSALGGSCVYSKHDFRVHKLWDCCLWQQAFREIKIRSQRLKCRFCCKSQTARNNTINKPFSFHSYHFFFFFFYTFSACFMVVIILLLTFPMHCECLNIHCMLSCPVQDCVGRCLHTTWMLSKSLILHA